MLDKDGKVVDNQDAAETVIQTVHDEESNVVSETFYVRDEEGK